MNNIKHTFELSGMGSAPYTVVAPKINPIELGQQFWCEHCGTQIKNRYFVKSSDNRIFTVGIDCLKKTGDQGLIDGAKRIRKELLAKEKEAKNNERRLAVEARERELNNGLSYEEYQELANKCREELRFTMFESFESHPVFEMLNFDGFGKAMQLQVYCGNQFTPNMLKTIVEIVARGISGARKGSKAFLAALPEATNMVDSLQSLIMEFKERDQAISQGFKHH